MSKKKPLSNSQKNKNKQKYNAIRKGYNKIKSNSSKTYIQYKHTVEAEIAKLYKKGTTLQNTSLKNVKNAIIKVNNSTSFVSAEERAKTNLLNTMKERFNDVYHNAIQSSRDVKGHYTSLLQNMKYDKYLAGYTFTAGNKTMFIDITNSPEEISIYEI